MPMLDPSHITSNALEKSGLITGASVIRCLNFLNALAAVADHWNSSFFGQSVIGAIIVLNPFMNRLSNVASP